MLKVVPFTRLIIFFTLFCFSEAFLAMNNVNAYQTVTDNMRFGLPPLSDVWESSITCIELYLPLPLDPGSKDARNMYPWLRCL